MPSQGFQRTGLRPAAEAGLSTGTLQLFKVKAEGAVAPPGVYGITHLGYPIYFLTILGVWKILGVVAVLIPKFPLLKPGFDSDRVIFFKIVRLA
jgi:hypothetical protein